ncbi:MAG: hypothetical protein EOO63_07630 [Hymenobacter sp.]|nr:MAG: hypothetical protein EOO63_07630 [Hymenobacter sp.]
MSSFRSLLQLGKQEFVLRECTYAFDQAVSERGLVTAKVRSGLLVLHLDVPTSDELLDWANDPRKKLSGTIVFHRPDEPLAGETLKFEEGFCVAYEENFRAGATPEGAYRCTLHISAASLAMGAVTKDNTWVATR